MTVTIERHELDVHEAWARVLRRMLDRLAALRTQGTCLSSQLVGAVDGAETALAYAAALGTIDDEVRAVMALGARAGAARFRAADKGGFTTAFGGASVEVPGDPLDSTITVGRFTAAWSLATAVDDTEALGWLVVFRCERMAGSVDEREIRICQALQGITEGRGAGLTLDEPIGPGPMNPARRRPMTTAIEEMLRSLDRGAEQFDGALADYLRAHRRYYDTKAGRADVGGAVALLGLSLVAVARRRGWPVAVTSRYMPLEALSPQEVT